MTDRPQWKDDAPLDARLRELAREYNRPSGEVPREAMWQAIAPAVRAAAQAPDIGPAGVSPITRKRRTIAPYAWSAALAAGLVLGIVLEREVPAPRAGSSAAATSRIADAQHAAPSAPLRTNGATVVAEAPSGAAQPSRTAGRGTPLAATQVATTGSRHAERSGASSAIPSGSASEGREGTGDGARAQQLYRLAARQTLVQAEALLTAYRAGEGQSRDQESMQQAGRWARDVLTSTRLLLDSPAANDPQMRALFTDLELVLAQIVQLSGAPLQADEREMIERAMRDRDLLPRLRSALPAGATTE
jgi:hypothetical protein